jgi:hypothetical protein
LWKTDGAALVPAVVDGINALPGAARGTADFEGVSRWFMLTEDGALVFASFLRRLPDGQEITPHYTHFRWFGGAVAPLFAIDTDGPLGPGLGPGWMFLNPTEQHGRVEAVSARGDTLFTSDVLNGSEYKRALYSAGPDGATLLATDGVPGHEPLGPGSVWTGLHSSVLWRSAMSPLGVVAAVAGAIDTHGATTQGIWLFRPGSEPEVVARQGDLVSDPRLPPGASFGPIRYCSINRRADVAFNATALGAALPSAWSDFGVWLYDGARSIPVALPGTDGEFGPALGQGREFDSLQLVPMVNARGEVAFAAPLVHLGGDDGPTGGAWRWNSGGMRPVALDTTDGPRGPGLGQGWVFRPFGYSLGFPVPSINVHGDITFYGEAIAPELQRNGVWVDDDAGLRPVVYTSLPVDVDPGAGADVRTISDVNFLTARPFTGGEPLAWGSGGEDGRPTPISDTREVAVLLGFTDGSSGVFKARYIDPCPGDVTGDLSVGADDLSALLSAFGTADSLTDLNADGVVNTSDLGLMLNRFGSACAPE